MSIIDDLMLEDTETFTIHLEKSLGLSNEFTVDPSVKVINITDNDGECTLNLQTRSVIRYDCNVCKILFFFQTLSLV